jgi:sugar/nucleoside kinase (ribokinase family)
MPILVVGSVATDSIRTPFGEAVNVLGGSATHFANAASLLEKVHLVGIVGGDFPKEYHQFFQRRGIDTEGLVVQEGGKTFHWEGFYEWDLNVAHTSKTELNVFEKFEAKIPDRYRSDDYVFLANIDPDLQMSVLNQTGKKHELVVSDTMNYWIEHKKPSLDRLFTRVDVVMMNDGEAREYCATTNLARAARNILRMGPKHVVVKKGEHGATLYSEDGIFTAPAYPLEEIKDPTGAGDTFAGGFVSFLAKAGRRDEATMRQAMVYGTVLASYAVQEFSVQGLVDVKFPEIQKRSQTIRKMVDFQELKL